MALPVWTINQISSNLSRPNQRWTTDRIEYGFPTSPPTWSLGYEGYGFSPLSNGQKTAARLAVSLIDDVIKPDFRETNSSQHVTLQNTTTNIDYAHAYLPGEAYSGGSVWFNANERSGTNSLVPPAIGNWGFMVFLHEIGHAMGLDHPGDYDRSADYIFDARYQQDSMMYSVMSYFTADYSGADRTASDGSDNMPQTPMLHDVKALQDMYGAERATRSGNTVYGFNATAGRDVYDFNKNQHPVITIWDGGGRDTLDFTGFKSRSTIDLNAGHFSDADGMTKNISIAFGTLIESAIGGTGNDILIGNNAANTLRGGGGNDTIKAGKGADRLSGGTGNDTLQGGSGADKFQFDVVKFGRDRIRDYDDGIDKLWFKKSIVDSVSDFSIHGNGTHVVELKILGQSLRLHDDEVIKLTGMDFFFV